MLLAHENGGLKVYADAYSLEFAKDRPFVYLNDESGSRIADLFVLSSVHPMNGRDDTTQVSAWRVEEGLNEMVFSLETSSSAWQSKTIRFRCLPRRFVYQVEVTGSKTGSDTIAEAVYFGGYSSAHTRWGSGFFGSGQHFQQGFNPEPTCDEIYTFPSAASSTIDMTGVPLPGRGDWFFTPPPFCFAFQTEKDWLGLGVEARPSENRFIDYQYHGGYSSFYLSLNFEGHALAVGRYALPSIGFDFGPDPYTLLAKHVQNLRGSGLVPNPAAGTRPAWWSEPLFCGWGSQCHLANIGGGRAPDYATQASYEAFLHTLAGQDILPGTVVIDDKWQLTYGENAVDPNKWPDLPGFIRSRHEAGQRVLLWLKAWDPEGIPAEECITNAAGLPLAFDPSNPSFEQRLRRSVRRMLAPVEKGGYDADGFKIDFTARIPSGPGIQTYGSAWGLELMRLYLKIVHEEARRTKPDAFVITHTPHPYLADLVDAVRLNDINMQHDVCSQMTHRARVATIACPEALIDMDNWPIGSKAAWREYLALKPLLGIPALYFASHIDSTGEPLTEADYDLIREVWADYRAGLATHTNRPAIQKISELSGDYLAEAKRLVLSGPRLSEVKPLKAWREESIGGKA